jgi:hypothetical protein
MAARTGVSPAVKPITSPIIAPSIFAATRHRPDPHLVSIVASRLCIIDVAT